MTGKGAVPRPVKSTEFAIEFGSREAAKGWRDLLATQKNALADAWTRLATDPLSDDQRCHALKGRLARIDRAGQSHAQRQIELARGARIWFYVDTARAAVVLVQVFTAHPNATK